MNNERQRFCRKGSKGRRGQKIKLQRGTEVCHEMIKGNI
jgi:hypothetical protein